MKIIEALKELPLIDKKITKNTMQIQLYAAFVDNGSLKPAFETEEKQRSEVAALIQSNNDLVSTRAKLRRRLAITNAQVQVTVGALTLTIAEWIEYRQYGFAKLIETYNALNINSASLQMQRTPVNPQQGIKITAFYDESQKNTELTKLLDMQGKIDAQLEMINATTDMVEA